MVYDTIVFVVVRYTARPFINSHTVKYFNDTIDKNCAQSNKQEKMNIASRRVCVSSKIMVCWEYAWF